MFIAIQVLRIHYLYLEIREFIVMGDPSRGPFFYRSHVSCVKLSWSFFSFFGTPSWRLTPEERSQIVQLIVKIIGLLRVP